MRSRYRSVKLLVIPAVALGAALVTSRNVETQGAPRSSGEVRRTADGKPDFSGIWQANSSANWDLLPHDARPMVAQPGVYPNVPVLAAPVVALGAVGWIPADRGVVEGDEIPYQPWAAARKKENAEHWLDRDPEIGCYLPGIPRAIYMPGKFQIVQGPKKVMMVFEYRNAERTINLDDVDPPPGDMVMGYSRGHWEGDTLVVNVSAFTPFTWLSRAGDFHSDALRVEERYTPLGPYVIRYEATIDDPQVFTKPWKISLPLYRRVEPDAQLVPFECIEMVEETRLGHLRKKPLVTHWEGNTMIIDVRRKVPPGDEVYGTMISGNPPEATPKK